MNQDHDPGDEDRNPVLPVTSSGEPKSLLDVLSLAIHVKGPGRLVALIVEENRISK